MHVFNVFFIKVKNMFFSFFICKVMFLTSMVLSDSSADRHEILHGDRKLLGLTSDFTYPAPYNFEGQQSDPYLAFSGVLCKSGTDEQT